MSTPPGTPSNLVELSWWIIDNPQIAGEMITLTAGEIKYALVFSNLEFAKAFLSDMNDSSLQIASLRNWVMKDAFLTAANILGVKRVMFDYVQGQHSAQSAPLENLIELMKTRVGS